MFSLARTRLCLQCVMGRQRREGEEEEEEEKSGVQREEVCIRATQATFLQLLTEILPTSITFTSKTHRYETSTLCRLAVI